MKKPNLLIVVCVIFSLTGLFLIYIAAINIEPKQLKISEINFEFVGRAVSTKGYINYKNSHPNGHIFLTLSDDGSNIQVPLFAGFVSALTENGFDINDLRKGSKIAVEGLVSEYRGELQIIPRKPSDVKILSG